MIDITSALATEGWMSDTELLLLGDLGSNCQNIAEIVSWMGRSTSAIAANTLGIVHAIDTWKGSVEHAEILKGKSEDYIFDAFKSNMALYTNVEPCRMPSLEAAKYFADQKFDLIFLDAAHDYENVKADILAWKPLLKENGILCGHDFHPWWSGVVHAVQECVVNYRVVDTIWVAE